MGLYDIIDIDQLRTIISITRNKFADHVIFRNMIRNRRRYIVEDKVHDNSPALIQDLEDEIRVANRGHKAVLFFIINGK